MWKRIVGSIVNPFNGIERAEVKVIPIALTKMVRIHSMELKV